MANRDGHRRFGSIRKRSSGRYQARYPGPDGVLRSAPQTFERKADADRYLTLIEAQMMRGEWIDPDRGKVTLDEYAERWIVQRPGLRPRTVHLYQHLYRKHIGPHLGQVSISALSAPRIRTWRADLLENGASISTAAKAYRLLRAILNTAMKEDELIRANPCRIPGADKEHSKERPVLTVAQVVALARRVPERYRALILVAAFACLRWGEVIALHRRDIDVATGTVHITKAYTEIQGQGLTLGPPKSKAGVRFVTVPAAVAEVLAEHLDTYVKASPDALVFTSENGLVIWRGNFNKLVSWRENVAAIGAAGLHFHDLRHTGNTLAARTGASLRDLMARMGHDSPRAALIYQHASPEADRAIADALHTDVSKLLDGWTIEGPQAPAKKAEEGPDDPDDGAAGVPARVG